MNKKLEPRKQGMDVRMEKRKKEERVKSIYSIESYLYWD